VALDAPSARRRRRLVSIATVAVGSMLLAATLRVPHGSTSFVVFGLLVATTWTVGALLSGPIPFSSGARAGPYIAVAAFVIGVIAYAAFVGAFLVARHFPVIGPALDRLGDAAEAGSILVVLGVALASGVGEELFFRGALHAAFGRHHPALASTAVYVIVTAATGNVALVVAAAVMGALFGIERLWTRGVLAPLVTHVTWSTLMVLALPR
jgi:uncharacterized protein